MDRKQMSDIKIGMLGYGWMARVHTFGLKSINVNIQSSPKIILNFSLCYL